MEFRFISREAYRKKDEPDFINKLKSELGHFYWIPEGGTNELAIRGCEEILTKDDAQFDFICVSLLRKLYIHDICQSSEMHAGNKRKQTPSCSTRRKKGGGVYLPVCF